jgi:hypothetical protein
LKYWILSGFLSLEIQFDSITKNDFLKRKISWFPSSNLGQNAHATLVLIML